MRKIIMNKKGSEWTVYKLVALILLVAVVIIVIVGVYTGALNPLGKKLKDTFNYVLGFFGEKDTGVVVSNKIECTILGKDRTCEVNYDDGWCKVQLDKGMIGDFVKQKDFKSLDNQDVISILAGDYQISYDILSIWQWDSDKQAFGWIPVKEAYSSGKEWKRNLYQSLLAELQVIDKSSQGEKGNMEFEGKSYSLRYYEAIIINPADTKDEKRLNLLYLNINGNYYGCTEGFGKGLLIYRREGETKWNVLLEDNYVSSDLSWQKMLLSQEIKQELTEACRF